MRVIANPLRRLWRRGCLGKAALLGLALLLLLCPCAVLVAVLPAPTPTPNPVGHPATSVPTDVPVVLLPSPLAIVTRMPSPSSQPTLTTAPSPIPSARPTSTEPPPPSTEPTATPAPSFTATTRPTSIPLPPPALVAATPIGTTQPTLAPSLTIAGRVQAHVVKIVDGDTIEVTIGPTRYTVRYIGMDTPERGQPYFEECTEQNRKLVENKTIELEKDVSETDRYGRLLRYVWVAGVMVNSELVRLGYAKAATYPPDVKYQDILVKLQREAREASSGLWAIPLGSPAEAKVIIRSVRYDGDVPNVESDEYAEIANTGTAPINLAGWRLNAGNPGQDFVFPDFTLQPGQSCRVYTNETHTETGGFSFASPRALWNNKGDCGYLYDAGGATVSQYCY